MVAVEEGSEDQAPQEVPVVWEGSKDREGSTTGRV